MTDNRARKANVLSIAENMQRKRKRREIKKTNEIHNVKSAEELKASAVSTPVANKIKKKSNALMSADPEVGYMEDPKLFTDAQLEQLGIVHPKLSNRALVDSFRQLRTKLFQLKSDGNFSIMVTSVVPEGGSSFVALNLAATIAFDREKTSLLIDGNFHDPVLHRVPKLLDLERENGILDYLSNPEIGIENIVSPSGIPRMRIIPIGARDEAAAEHFTSKMMQRFIKDVQRRYDNRYIVIDAPSISTSPDAQVMADLCDYILLVVPYGQVTPSQIDAAVEEIDERKLAGIVLNNEPLLKH